MFVLDCDPGIDDAAAILLMLAAPELAPAAVTVVAGNVESDLGAWNARGVVDIAGRPAPVFAGCPRPMLYDHVHAKHIHGDDGLNGGGFRAPATPLQPRHAVDFLIATLDAAAPNSVTLCFVGPLTNLAVVLVQRPDLAAKVEKLVMMGGAIGVGNVTPAAEYNIYVDPHAAHVVFAAPLKRVLLPLEATATALFDPATLARWGRQDNAATRFLMPLLARPVTTPRYGGRGRPIHDLCAVAYCLWPELFAGRDCWVDVATEPGANRGRTSIDHWGVEPRANCFVVDRIDREPLIERVLAVFAAAYGDAGAAS
jgi:purine nucleosidase